MTKLTNRQADVYELAILGQSPKEIAFQLGLSVPRVRKHLDHIHQRKGVHSRPQLLAQEIHRLKCKLAEHGIFE